MDKITVSTTDLKAFIELLKVYGGEKNDPTITDMAWQMDDIFFNIPLDGEDFKTVLQNWSEGQISFITKE
jgi:hypothetical protein